MPRGRTWLAAVLVLSGAGLLGALLGVPLADPASAQSPDECRYDPDTGEYECTFEDDDDGGNESGDEAWWATSKVEVGLAVVGLTGSVVGGGYAALKRRRRRRNLRELLDEADEVYSRHKTRPAEGIPALTELRATVREEHHSGGLSDEQFLELDNRVGERLAKLRLLEVERELPEVPDGLERELTHVIEDGVVTPEDVEHIAEECRRREVPDELADPLVGKLEAWAEADEASPDE